jgi:hypothetical protein
MNRKKDIRSDSRYVDFCVRYRHNLERYMAEAVGVTPSWQQLDAIRAIQPPGSRVAISSGHGTGKSFLYAVLCDWLLRAYPQSNTIITATNIEQVRSVVWKELDTVIGAVNERYPWMSGDFVKETRRYYVKGCKDSWYVMPRTAPKYKPESIAGQHRQWYTVLVDEASAVDDEVLGVLRGALTNKNNRFVMVSQPTRSSGHFAEAFSTLGDLYRSFFFNAEESPLVDREFIREKLREYGGHHSPEYQIKVLGRFPDRLAGYLIPRSWCLEAQQVNIAHSTEWGWVITVDVGEGVYRDSSVYVVGKVSGYDEARNVETMKYHETNEMDPKKFGRLIHQEACEYPNVTIAVDSDGPGLATALELEELGHDVLRIHWGRPPHAEKDKKRYQDQRAYAAVQARQAIFEGRLKIVPGSKVVDQASKIPYDFDRRGRYVIMPKTQMRSEGIRSPDIFDCHCFFYLADYVPVGKSGRSVDQDELLKWAGEILQ